MKRFTLFASLLVLFSLGCGEDSTINPISQIGRADGWKISAITSDMEQKVDAAIAALTDEQINADPRSREELEQEYEERISTTTIVDECDRDDVFFFVSNGTMRLILLGANCPADGFSHPLFVFNDRTYSVNNDASEVTIRSSGGVFLDRFNVVEISENSFILEGPRSISDTIFTDLTYQIRYDLIPE